MSVAKFQGSHSRPRACEWDTASGSYNGVRLLVSDPSQQLSTKKRKILFFSSPEAEILTTQMSLA